MTLEYQRRLLDENARQNLAWGHIVQDRWDAVAQYAGQTVLDVGCSNGVYLQRLLAEGKQAYGADLLPDDAWQYLPGRCMLSDARELPFADDAFDTIISFETLEHVPQPERALREYHRVCRRNIIISVPNTETPAPLRESGLTFHHWIDRTHVNFYSLPQLREVVEGCGFRIVKAEAINRIIPGGLFLHSLGLPLRLSVRLGRVIRRFSLRSYAMSLLVVAEKI